MSTPALIAYSENHKYYNAYVHHDGYREGVGDTLKEFYSDFTKLKSVVDRGDMSSLEFEIDDILYYDDGRESAERVAHTINDLKEQGKHLGCEYLYIGRLDSNNVVKYRMFKL